MREMAHSPTAPQAWVTEKILMGHSLGSYLRSLVTPFNAVAVLILAVGIPVTVYRFAYGLGAATNLSQSSPWGIWIGFDVLSGVALAAGGYTMATAVYVFGMEKYRPVVRPAVLTGFLGYMFWAAECPNTRNVCTVPPNSCEGGMGVGATQFDIPIPMPALRTN